MDTTERQKIAAKIQALLSKTTGAGATEEEMMAAMTKAYELMSRYNISMTEAELANQSMGAWSFTFRTAEHKALAMDLAYAIGIFTDTLSMHTDWKFAGSLANAEPVLDKLGFLTFAGRETDVQFALWLIGSLEAFVMRGVDRFVIQAAMKRMMVTADRKKIRKSYLFGAAQRISVRMLYIKQEADKATAATSGRALVVSSNQDRIAAYLKSNGIDLGKMRKSKTRQVYADAFANGQALGNQAQFARPVDTDAVRRLPGR